jgi:predicted RNase H-like HicB family nuclease
MVAMTSYTAVCRRTDVWWAISVPELKGVHTQARRLNGAEAMVREAIALFLDVAPNSFAVTLRAEVPEAQESITEALIARQAAREADEKAAAATRAALKRLTELGLTVRDAGQLLGISPQRVSQLTSNAAKAPAPTTPTSDHRPKAWTQAS